MISKDILGYQLTGSGIHSIGTEEYLLSTIMALRRLISWSWSCDTIMWLACISIQRNPLTFAA